MRRKVSILTVAVTAVLGASHLAFADDMNVGAGVIVDRDTGDTRVSRNTQFGNSDITLGGNVGPLSSARRGVDLDPRTGLDRAHPAN